MSNCVFKHSTIIFDIVINRLVAVLSGAGFDGELDIC